MKIEGCVAFVTGANRGLGKAYAEALLAAGAARVYAGARDPRLIDDSRLVPVKLDVTHPDDVAAAARDCRDVTLLVNNAGILRSKSMLAKGAANAMREEMEVNVYGLLAMTRAFAPILRNNGGGAIVNVLSVTSWFTSPRHATYSASKHAALVVTEGTRMELKSQGTQVVGVFAGFIDTDMAAAITQPKISPRQVTDRTIDALTQGHDSVLADARAVEVWNGTRLEPDAFAQSLQQVWADYEASRNSTA